VGHPEVLDEESVGPPWEGQGRCVGSACGREFRQKMGNQREPDHDKVERQDAVDAADVESLKVARRRASVEEDASDEEPGEDEEEIDAAPGKLSGG
jgi:hypothetical protein